MLSGASARHGYDWWWHSLVGEHAVTGEKKPFFIEYYVINPALSPQAPVFGQDPAVLARGSRQAPSYAMIKAGAWGADGKAQIHNFWPAAEFSASPDHMEIRIGPHRASETELRGSVSLSAEEAAAHPEYMADPGSMSWDLRVRKDLVYSVGYGASAPFRALRAFQMFWHVGGMRTSYEGDIMFQGERYVVRPETCAGYQDKNWGSDYTSPWIWLNCNNFTDTQGRPVPGASLDVGGGQPRVFGLPLGEKVLAAFHHQGTLYEFNFSHVWRQSQRWACRETETHVFWDLDLANPRWRMTLNFSCPKEDMLLVNYENPRGEKHHRRLWNGGHAAGTLMLHPRDPDPASQPLVLYGTLGGCEYGRV